MKFYITGAAGMIGSNLVRKMVSRGDSVIGVDNLYRGKLENLNEAIECKNFRYIHADLSCDLSWAQELSKDDVIIHLADIVAGIGFVFGNEWSIFNKNIAINSNIARAVALLRPSQLIYVGTACSYPRAKQLSVTDSELCEEDKFPAEPESGYGWGKLVGDIEYKFLCKEIGTKYVCLDLHNVYGTPCDFNPGTAQVLPSLVYKALTSETIDAWGDGMQGRAFLHVNDVVSAICKAIDKKISGEFMLGPRKCTTIKEAVNAILDSGLVKAKAVEWDVTKPTGDIGRYANGVRAEEILGWTPQVSFEDGIHELISWIKQKIA
jgi:nucleoside-diphosphate-sugar epimerase